MLHHMNRAVSEARTRLLYIDAGTSTTTTSATKTINLNIGDASSDRWVIVLFQHPVSVSGRTVSSATINAVSASIGYNTSSATTLFGYSVFYANVASGTTGVTITAVLTGTSSNFPSRFIVFSLYGKTTLSYTSVQDTGSATTTTRTTSTSNVAGNNFVLNQWSAGIAASSPAWSGTPSAPTQQGNTSDGLMYGAVFNNLGDTLKATVGTTFTTSNSIACRLFSSLWSYT